MEKIILKVVARELLGKGACRRLRVKGEIPGVVYKDGKEGLSVQVDGKALLRALHTEAGENAIITLDISGKPKKTEKIVIVKDVQRHPVNDRFLHVDFQEISLEEKLKFKVPIVIKGEAAGVKEEDGVLTQEVWELEVECLPTDIPERIEVQVDHLRIGDSVHVKELKVPEGVLVLNDPEQSVVSVIPPQEELPEAAPAEEVAEPEVIKKGKEEEEEVPGGEGKEEAKEAPAAEKEKEEKSK